MLPFLTWMLSECKNFAPFKWSFQNAESLSFVDDSFDYVVIMPQSITSVPHKVLTEMYRVAKKGVLAFESGSFDAIT